MYQTAIIDQKMMGFEHSGIHFSYWMQFFPYINDYNILWPVKFDIYT